MRWTVLRTSSSTSAGRMLEDVPSLISEALIVKSNQRLKGPQPSKKGRTPGPGWEGNGAGEPVSFLCIDWLRNVICVAKKYFRKVCF